MPVSPSAVARVVGIGTTFRNLLASTAILPQRVALIGQHATLVAPASLDPVIVTSAVEVGNLFGFGSPVHLAAQLLLPENGDGLGSVPLTVYPVEDDAGGQAASSIITSTGTQVGAAEYQLFCSGVPSAKFVLDDGDTPADIGPKVTIAINSNVSMPVIAIDGASDDSDCNAKWEGTSSNDLVWSLEGPDNGITFTLPAFTAGLVNPGIQSTLDKIDTVWETMIVSCMEPDDSDALDALHTTGEGKWDPLVYRPFVAFTGANDATTAPLRVIAESRKETNRSNSFAVALGSLSMPFMIAARAVARIARQANDNPPVDYPTQLLQGIEASPDSAAIDYTARNLSVTQGVSTTLKVNGTMALEDTVTFFHPDGQTLPAYRWVVDIVKIQNILFNTSLIFNAPEWAGAPLIKNGQATTNAAARKPSAAVAEVNVMIDQLALSAILTDPAAAKLLTTANINDTNNRRLDVFLLVQISGNSGVISVDLNWGFFFGTPALIAA